jgi:hypothetical protein
MVKAVVRIFGRALKKKKRRSFGKLCLEDQRFNDMQNVAGAFANCFCLCDDVFGDITKVSIY